MANLPSVEKHRSSIFNKSFLCKAPSTWNMFGNNIKNATKLNVLVNQYKKSIFNS